MSKKSIEAAWTAFYEANQKTTIESMNAEGWRTMDQVAKDIGLSRSRVNNLALDGKLEMVKKKILSNGKTREFNFVRPIA